MPPLALEIDAYKTVAQAMEAAAAERRRKEAEAEAERLRKEAEAEAERLRKEAEAEAERLRLEKEKAEKRRMELEVRQRQAAANFCNDVATNRSNNLRMDNVF